nr:2-amino-4-oxopentanoate thiolase subunit OrtA [uncultured Dethiosulfovibrio sp.]
MNQVERAKKGDWVQVKQIVLPPEGRAPQAPEDTKATPLLLWVKGFAKSDGAMGDEISVETLTGREVKGELSAINPRYVHDFGDFVPEFLVIDVQLRSLMEEV